MICSSDIRQLEPPDSHCVAAACGWLGLGDLNEAEAELAQVRPGWQAHPEVMQVRWQIHARRSEWQRSLDIAKSLTQIAPERRFGWIHLAYSLHQVGQTIEAKEILLYALDMFAPNATMAFYLSRYCCRLGNLSESREWLIRAFEMVRQTDERARLMERALSEPDLAPLRNMIEHLA